MPQGGGARVVCGAPRQRQTEGRERRRAHCKVVRRWTPAPPGFFPKLRLQRARRVGGPLGVIGALLSLPSDATLARILVGPSMVVTRHDAGRSRFPSR